jgi:hypothetical protein
MVKQINTSMRLLLSCGSDDICSVSDSAKESQSLDLYMVNETSRPNKSTKQHESNCQMHQLNSPKDNRMVKQINTSMRLLLSCGSDDICSVSDSALTIASKEFQSPGLNMVSETLRMNKSTKQHESNCQMHQLNSPKDKTEECVFEEETEDNISGEPATKRKSNEVIDIPLNIETPSRGSRGRRVASRCSVIKYNLEDDSNTEELKQSDEPERREKSLEILTARQLTEPTLSRRTSSCGLRPSLQRLWVSMSNIKIEGRPTIKESEHDSEEDPNITCQEDQFPSILVGRDATTEEPESRSRFFQFSQLKTRSLRTNQPQLQPAWSSFRSKLIIEDKESDTSEEDYCPVPEETEPRQVQNTNQKRNWPGMGLRGVAYVVKVKNLDTEDGAHDRLSKKNTKSHKNEPSSQPILRSSSAGLSNRSKLQRRNSITKFNLDSATNESFRRMLPRMDRRNSVTQYSLGVETAQAETTSNCVLVSPKISRPKLSRHGQAMVLILSKESLDLAHNAMAPNAA